MEENEYIFKLSVNEINRLINALNDQTNRVVSKLQAQYAEQTRETVETVEPEDQLLMEDNNGNA